MDQQLRQGLNHLHEGAYEHAHSHAIALIRQNPHNPVPYYLLGQIALEHHNFAKASELFIRSQQLAPEEPIYIVGYAQYLVTTGDQASALTHADKAAQLPIDDGWTADTIGVVYSRTGFHEKAIPFFELAVKLNPAMANFHYNLGASLQFSGEFTGAKNAFRATIERDPRAYRAYSSLVSLNKQTLEDNDLTRLENLFDEMQDDPDAALHLGHAIAKTKEDCDQHTASFDWLVRAKLGKRTAIDYQLHEDLELFEASARTFNQTAQTLNANETEAPIFVIGLPRTGTTLIDRILSSHSEVESAGELNTFAGLIKSASSTPSNRVLDVETLEKAAAINLEQIGTRYLQDTRHLARGATRFIDKMPLNFFYAGLIHQTLPNAKIIVLRRDPLDSCLSNFRQLFSTGYSYYNYALNISDTGAYYKAFDKLIAHWMSNIASDKIIEIHYEDVVHDQVTQTRRLLEFCHLSWEENCLRFYENKAPVSTASSVQVRQPLYAGSIGRWKKYGHKLDGLRESLGYEANSSRGT